MIYPMELIERQQPVGWAQVQPARYASRPAEYLQALAEENKAWDDRDVLIELQLAGHNVDADLDAAERRIKLARAKASRIFYLLNLKPITDVDIARSDAQDVGL